MRQVMVMWRSRLWLFYCVSTPIRRYPPFTRVESTKSTRRELPPKGTAGLAPSALRGGSPLPPPPARTNARNPGREVGRAGEAGGGLHEWVALGPGRLLAEPDVAAPPRPHLVDQRRDLEPDLGRVRRAGAEHDLGGRVDGGGRAEQVGDALLPGD